MTAMDYGQGEAVLSRAAGMVADAKVDLDLVSQRLAADVESMRAQWGGQGALAFAALGAAWNDKQRRIVAALDGFEANLRTTEKDNLATDDAQRGAMASLQSALGSLPGA
ncbi:WXG100 family type VII secretion target [Nocardioides acrostichi]|uniref:WXG100 family type VII secretion target n=1 Tax=Nocardioides acrostichi TaxID=2784339 RepID=A0A930V3X3_9ACTN|nr:WXG100 family type VII secretion target [Nocardioides acrostichi]MBF4163544.1 WXG100 family type VII secretion target [Nocardioides acrostichi]